MMNESKIPGPASWAPLSGGHEDVRPDDGADAQGGQVDGGQIFLELGV